MHDSPCLLNRGYMTVSVLDRFLCFRKIINSSLFTSGEIMSENATFGAHE